jgi:predicted RNase H-like nuclease (RuvC/YqgF family)
MTNSISSTDVVNKASSMMSSSSTTQLSETTKKKLQDLGIDSSNIKTEAQAQQAIKEKEATTANSQNSQQKSQDNGQPPQGGQSQSSSIITEAKSLASKVGASVSDSDSADDIISKVSAKISSIKAEAGDDETKLKQVESYQNELSLLQKQASQQQQMQSMLTGSMDAMAAANKLSLGL